MQLNSTLNHSIIVIDTINASNLVAAKFKNDLHLFVEYTGYDFTLDKNQPTGTATIAEFEIQKAYEYLVSLPEFEYYELAEGKNWKFADEIIRLIVDKNKLTPHLLDNDAVGQLVSYVLADPPIKQKTIDTLDGYIYIYLKFIKPEHLPILEGADCIVIDYLS